MKLLLDTDHATILQFEEGAEFARLLERILRHGPSNLTSSVVSFHEQAMGCHAYINRASTPAEIVRGYGMFSRTIKAFAKGPILPLDESAVAAYEELRSHRLRIATMDLRIAAIALSRDLTLLTRNVADFGRVPGLRTEDWTR